MLNPILRHGPLCDVEPEEVKLRLDTRRAPQRVLARDTANQITNLFVNWWTANRLSFAKTSSAFSFNNLEKLDITCSNSQYENHSICKR